MTNDDKIQKKEKKFGKEKGKQTEELRHLSKRKREEKRTIGT